MPDRADENAPKRTSRLPPCTTAAESGKTVLFQSSDMHEIVNSLQGMGLIAKAKGIPVKQVVGENGQGKTTNFCLS